MLNVYLEKQSLPNESFLLFMDLLMNPEEALSNEKKVCGKCLMYLFKGRGYPYNLYKYLCDYVSFKSSEIQKFNEIQIKIVIEIY